MNQREVNRLGKKWQRLLRLQHWDIDFYLVRRYRMDSSDTTGKCYPNIIPRTAQIKIAHPLDFSPEDMQRNPVELTIIHELLHVVFAESDARSGESLDHIANEQAIEHLAIALFNMSGEHVG